MADEVDVPLLPDSGVSLACAAHFAHIEDVLVTVDMLPLGHRTEAMFKLIHDAIQLGFVDGDVTRLIRPASVSPYAATRWGVEGLGELRVPWIGVTWPTFLHRDGFASAWNEGIDCVHKVIGEASEIGGISHGAHAILVAAESLLAAVRICPTTEEEAPPGEPPDDTASKEQKEAAKLRKERNRRRPMGLATRADLVSRPMDAPGQHWRFAPDVAARLADAYSRLLQIWSTGHGDNKDDALADAQLDVLVDIACLCTPEVWPGEKHEQLHAFGAAVWALLTAPADAGGKSAPRVHLCRQIRRRRMDRIRAGGSPLMALVALRLVTANTKVPLALRLMLAQMPPSDGAAGFAIPDACALVPADVAIWLYTWAQSQPESAWRADVLRFAESLVAR